MSRPPAHARWPTHPSSARSSRYGIHPICPSEYASFSFGNCTSLPENSQSLIDAMALLKLSVAATAVGASPDVAGIRDDEPMCMLITVPVSSHTAKNGSQYPE